MSETGERIIRPTSIETYEHQPSPALNPQDLAQLGAMMVTAGLTTLQARALVAKVQQAAAQTALMLAPDIMEEVRKVQEARMLTILQHIQVLPRYLSNYIRRDQVLQIIQMVMSTTPRQ